MSSEERGRNERRVGNLHVAVYRDAQDLLGQLQELGRRKPAPGNVVAVTREAVLMVAQLIDSMKELLPLPLSDDSGTLVQAFLELPPLVKRLRELLPTSIPDESDDPNALVQAVFEKLANANILLSVLLEKSRSKPLNEKAIIFLNHINQALAEVSRSIANVLHPGRLLSNPSEIEARHNAIRERADLLRRIKKESPAFGKQIRDEAAGSPSKYGKDGWKLPESLREELLQRFREDASLDGYGDSLGEPEFRQVFMALAIMEDNPQVTFDDIHAAQAKVNQDSKHSFEQHLVEIVKVRGGGEITIRASVDDMLFVAGGGVNAWEEVIEAFYRDREGNILTPEICHPSLSNLLSKRDRGRPLFTYRVDLEQNGDIDVSSIQDWLERFPDQIEAIFINYPPNPTGFHSEESLRKVFELAKQYGKPIITDEVYRNLVLDDGVKLPSLRQLAHEYGVGLIRIRSISKDLLAGGHRLGIIEVVNAAISEDFAGVISQLKKNVKEKVCPPRPAQELTRAYLDPRLYEWLKTVFCPGMKRNRNTIAEIIRPLEEKGLAKFIPSPAGMYGTIVFPNPERLDPSRLKMKEDAPSLFNDQLAVWESRPDLPFDQRLVLGLAAQELIFTIALSEMGARRHCGLRVTLLDPDLERVRETFTRLVQAIERCEVKASES